MSSKDIGDPHHAEAQIDSMSTEKGYNDRRISVAAREIAVDEKAMTTKQAIRANPAAICWSLVISTCVIMEGFDTALLGNFWAYPSFQRKFGDFVGVTDTTRSGYQIPASWQTGLGQASGVGAFFGAIFNGWLVNRFGPRMVLIASLCSLSAFLFITFFAPDRPTLLVGQLLCGLPWGVFATTAPAYASEVLPLQLRVYMTSYTNMCWIIGQLIAGGVLRGLVTREDSWGYRIPFAIQWVWPIILVPAVYLAPESPWFLVRRDRPEEAENAIRRLQSASSRQDPKKMLAAIIYTNELEQQLSVGTTYWDCFKGFELRRTEIACMVFAGQLVCGSVFAYASTYFFEQVGLGPEQAYSLGVGANGLALFACLCNWFVLMPYVGRRTVYVWGMGAMTIELFLIGILNVWTSNPSVAWAQAILTMVWTVTFQLSAGQLGWALPAEIGSSRLRTKTVVLGRNSYYICAVVGGTLQNYMMNPTAWNIKGYTGFFWGGFALLTFIWAYFRLPETKGRTFHEIDILFAQETPARKFASTNLDNLSDTEVNGLAEKYADTGSRRASVFGSIRP